MSAYEPNSAIYHSSKRPSVSDLPGAEFLQQHVLLCNGLPNSHAEPNAIASDGYPKQPVVWYQSCVTVSIRHIWSGRRDFLPSQQDKVQGAAGRGLR
jgi:hypothetical protein